MQVAATDTLMNSSIFLPARSITSDEKHVATTCTAPTITADVLELGDEFVSSKIFVA